MKKSLYCIIYFLGLFLIFLTTIKAQITLEIDNPIISFTKIQDFGLQGFTVVNDYLFMILEGHDDTESIIKIYDLNTYEEIKSYNFGSLGHANDVTYNSKNNKIYVLASSGSKSVYVFDGSNFEYLEEFKVELPIRSITYIEDKDIYAVRTISSGFFLDNKFNLNKFPFIIGMNINTDIGKQGWAYYNGLIYYSTWSWIKRGGDGVNIIYVYDFDGKLKDSIFTNNDIGEIEDVAFYKDKMILGFNGYDGNIKFYLNDIPTITEEVFNTNNKEKNASKNKAFLRNNIFLFGGLFIVCITLLYIIKLRKRG